MMSQPTFLGVSINKLNKIKSFFNLLDTSPESGFYISLYFAIRFMNTTNLEKYLTNLDANNQYNKHNKQEHDIIRDLYVNQVKTKFILNKHYVIDDGNIYFNAYGFKWFCMTMSNQPQSSAIMAYFLMCESKLIACIDHITDLAETFQ
jgi:hypothetical protein